MSLTNMRTLELHASSYLVRTAVPNNAVHAGSEYLVPDISVALAVYIVYVLSPLFVQ